MSSSPPEATRALRRAAHEAARLRLARLRVHGGPSLRKVFAEGARLAAKALDADRVGVWVFTDDGAAIRCCEQHERGRDASPAGTVLARADYPHYFAALEERRVIVADDAREHPDTRELVDSYLVPLGIGSMLDAPIYRGGRVIGVVCHERFGPPRPWSQADIEFAGSVADTVAQRFEEAARQDAELALQAHQAHAVEVQKMEALGRVCAGVAHDFRNILTVVLGHAGLIAGDPAATPALRAECERIRDAAERGVELTRQLSTIGRTERPSQVAVVGLGDLLEGFAPLIRSAAGGRHPVEIVDETPRGRVLVAPAQLERVILNLVLNARDAMPDGGTIGIRVREREIEDGDGAAGPYLVVEVSDQGAGMDAMTLERLFEPFFTTKPEGTGLGLPIAYGIVEQAGGFLHVDSAPGEGTTMSVYLPRVAG